MPGARAPSLAKRQRCRALLQFSQQLAGTVVRRASVLLAEWLHRRYEYIHLMRCRADEAFALGKYFGELFLAKTDSLITGEPVQQTGFACRAKAPG